MKLHSCTYRCPVTDVTLADVLLGAGIGAAGTAGIDALTGQPVTWKGEATGAALGGAGGVLAGGFGAGAAPGAGAAGGSAGVSTAGDVAAATPAVGAGAGGLAAGTPDWLGWTGTAMNATDPAATLGVTGASAADTGLTSDMTDPVTVSGLRETSVAPPYLAQLDPSAIVAGQPASPGVGTDPLQKTADPMGLGMVADTTSGADPMGLGMVPAGPDPTGMDPMGLGFPAQGGDQGFWDQLTKYLKTPRGALTAAGLGANLYGILGKTSLPGAAKTALNAAGPAVQQAQATISTGGYGAPQWIQQKSAIDAQINQQIAEATRALQQNAQSGGMGGANSAAVQQQIATLTAQFETQRQTLYAQALKMNVNNAVSELTGGNATLMAIAQLQQEQERWAADLARSISGTTGQLATLYPTTSPQSASA